MIKIDRITHKYGNKLVLDSLVLKIPRGIIFGLLGPNAAGKTTLVNIISGVLTPTSGEISVNNIDVLHNPIKVKKIIGVVPEAPIFYRNLTVNEHLDFMLDVYKIRKEDGERKKTEVLNLLKLTDFKNMPAKMCSKGTRQKLMLGMAFIHDPTVLLLDEPTSGLDIETARGVKDFIKKLRDNDRTVFLTTHIVEIAEKICDVIAILHNHNIVLQGDVGHIIKFTNTTSLEDAFLSITSK